MKSKISASKLILWWNKKYSNKPKQYNNENKKYSDDI